MKKAVTSYVAALIVGLPLAALAEMPPAGTTVTKDNLDKYKESLTATQQYFVRNGMTVPVIEYKKYDWPPKYKEATEKYSSQVKLSPDGRDMLNYVAGAPFPTIDDNDPQAGAKWMWNHEQKTPYTDNVGCGWNVELVNSSGTRERFFGSNFWRRMMWRGRMYMDPKPVVAHDPAVGYTEQWGPLHDPNDLKGSGVLNFRYVSPDVPDDSYLYLPELRKVRRLLGHGHRHRLDLDVELEAVLLDVQVPRGSQATGRFPCGWLCPARGLVRSAGRHERYPVLRVVRTARAARDGSRGRNADGILPVRVLEASSVHRQRVVHGAVQRGL